MSNPSKAKGYAFEARIRDWLRTHGAPHIERLPAGATSDRGDLTGTPGVVWELKNHARVELPGWINELKVELANARCEIGAVIHHRSGNGDPAEDLATMPLRIYVRLLHEAGYLTEEALTA